MEPYDAIVLASGGRGHGTVERKGDTKTPPLEQMTDELLERHALEVLQR